MKWMTASMIAFAIVLSVAARDGDSAYRQARRDGALTKFQIHVVDDSGQGVSNAEIRVFLGMNFVPKGRWLDGVSDSDGFFDIEGVTCGDEIIIDVKKAGWYPSRKKLCYAMMGAEHKVKDGKWQPFGSCEEVRLRPIKNPARNSLSGKFVYTRRLDRWLGFDLEANDFVSPEGVGKISDFELRINWTGRWDSACQGIGVDVRFADAMSGYCLTPVCQTSSFKGPYCADINGGFSQSASFYEGIEGVQALTGGIWRTDSCWVVRSRCKVSPDGKLLKANYSAVYNIEFVGKRDGSGGVRIYRVFNPTPNDTSLEPMSYEAKKWLKAKKLSDQKVVQR